MTTQIALTDSADDSRFELFDYQHQFIHDIYDALRDGHRKVACVAPTGSGKTVVMTQICEHALTKSRRILILVHLDVLVPQTLDKLKAFGLHHRAGCIKAGYPEDRDACIQVASIQTLSRRRWWRHQRFDLVIFDEAHQTLFSAIGQKIRYETHPDAIVMAFTATPYRLSKREGMGDHLDTLVHAPTPVELQSLGRLAEMRYFSFSGADLKKIATVGGDFKLDDLKLVCDRSELIDHIVAQWQRLTPNKRTIAFCVGVEHAHNVRDAFRAVGVIAEAVTGETPRHERRRLYKALASGSLTVLTSVNVVSIGFDVPSVEVGLGLRPTKSLALHHQQIGRVMRTADGKACGYWLDQAGNCQRLGLPEDVDGYELTKGNDKPPEPAPRKVCPACGSLELGFAKVCSCCGYEFPREETIAPSGDFVELQKAERKRSPAENHYRKLLRDAFKKGYDPGWAKHQLKLKHPTARPLTSWQHHAIFGDEATDDDRELYYTYLKSIATRRGKSPTWALAQFSREFPSGHVWFAKNVLAETKADRQRREKVTRAAIDRELDKLDADMTVQFKLQGTTDDDNDTDRTDSIAAQQVSSSATR